MVAKWPFMSHNSSGFVFTKLQNTGSKKNVIYVVAFDPIKSQTCFASQNDHLNLFFVKGLKVVGEKMIRNGLKMANS